MSLGHILSLSGCHSLIYEIRTVILALETLLGEGGSEARVGLLPGVQGSYVIDGFLSPPTLPLPLHSSGLRAAPRTERATWFSHPPSSS